jgi:hypothetical protein
MLQDGLFMSFREPHISVAKSHCASEYQWDTKGLGIEIFPWMTDTREDVPIAH